MYTPLFFSWTNRLGLGEHEAADFVQDLFAVLVERLPTFVYDPQCSFRAYLKTILLNRWRNHLRDAPPRQSFIATIWMKSLPIRSRFPNWRKPNIEAMWLGGPWL